MKYKAKVLPVIDAVKWNGEDFVAVQVVCPQVTRVSGSTLNVPGVGEVYPGEIVCRDMETGSVTKMQANVFEVLYERGLF